MVRSMPKNVVGSSASVREKPYTKAVQMRKMAYRTRNGATLMVPPRPKNQRMKEPRRNGKENPDGLRMLQA